MRKVLLVLFALTLFVGCAQMSAEEIAKKIEEKYDSVKDFRGNLRFTATSESGNFTIEYEFVFKKPNKVWMRSEKLGILIVSNGEKTWVYNEKENEVVVMGAKSYGAVDPDYGSVIKDMLKRYDVKLLGTGKVSGRDCYVISLKPKTGEGMKVKIWVDKEFWYPLRIESYFGGVKSVAEYSNVSFNTGVSDEFFNFTPPEGAKVKTEEELGIRKFKSVEEAQKFVNFKVLKPSYTAGYELKEVTVVSNSVSMVYVRGSEVMTIIENVGGKLPEFQNAEKVKIGESSGIYAEFYGNKVLSFKKGDVIVTITGRLDKSELLKIAESMDT